MTLHDSAESGESVTSTETDEEPSLPFRDGASSVLVFGAPAGVPAEPASERASNTSMRTAPSRRRLAGTILTVVIFAGAAALGALGWQAHSAASDARRDAKSASHERARLVARGRAADHDGDSITAAEKSLRTTFAELLNAFDAEADSENRVIDLMSESVHAFDQGNTSSALDMWRTQVDPAIAQQARAVSALRTAIDAVDPTVQKLQETLRG